jgi:hypothetical protein
VPVPDGLHVSSLVPWITDPDPAPAGGAAYAEYHGDEWGLYSMRMIRTESQKYVYSPHGTDELYDLVIVRPAHPWWRPRHYVPLVTRYCQAFVCPVNRSLAIGPTVGDQGQAQQQGQVAHGWLLK